ncbi:DNA-directed RNA polymerase subunit alpha C-terminal domain-containing protein [Sphingomonas morindae]|uniref:DNA-directed RNA polymerase subunit alpha C-terminal domain-containing protein n=1 Tax=Sphingomonas morindae TaxID=1541170 RepID=UPI00207863A5|nr:DNA-directed RNA polymerase subunit alpha C-terminal domain-containing protein [Sphingomonas morindae]
MEPLGLSTKVLDALHEAGISAPADLNARSPRELALLPGVGTTSLAELLDALDPAEMAQRRSYAARIAELNERIAAHHAAIAALEADIAALRAGRDPY